MRAGMMSISPCTAEPVWLSPPRRQETFAAAPTWMATSTLCSSGTSRTPAGSERSCRASPPAVSPKGTIRGSIGFTTTFGDDLGGLIFSLKRLYVREKVGVPFRSIVLPVYRKVRTHRMSLEVFNRTEWLAFDAVGRRLRVR